MSTLLDEVLSDMNSAVPPQQDQYYDQQEQQLQHQEPPRQRAKKRVHFEDDSDDDSGIGFMDKLKGAFDKDSLRVPATVLVAVLLASLPQINDLIEGIPYISDNWMTVSAFKAIVLAIIVYFMKLG